MGSFVPPGTFLMGGTEHDVEKPIHLKTLAEGFFLGVDPVTQLQWKAVMGTDPSHFKGANKPVEYVSWDDCQEFCKTLTDYVGGLATVRLPTEAEWEYACRSGTTTHYHFGDVPNTDLANYYGKYTWNGSPQGVYRKGTTDVGMFPPNPWGLYYLHGNVWEWCADRFRAYAAEKRLENDENSNNSSRVLRGGAWYYDPDYCRGAYRNWCAPANRSHDFGLRVCFRLD